MAAIKPPTSFHFTPERKSSTPLSADGRNPRKERLMARYVIIGDVVVVVVDNDDDGTVGWVDAVAPVPKLSLSS